jgi:lysophospholipase L1-like esterase
MNVNPDAIRILCYGDSNIWGDPGLGRPRFKSNIRWPGKLQELLGNEYEIIEEGLCGRTTDIDDPKKDGRNGKAYLRPCLETHKPIDFFVLLLGTNDFKTRFNKSAEDVAQSIKNLTEIVKNSESGRDGQGPKIILLSPPLLEEESEMSAVDYKDGPNKTRQLGPLLEKLAEEKDYQFINLANHVKAGEDGGHLTAEGHLKVAQLLSELMIK